MRNHLIAWLIVIETAALPASVIATFFYSLWVLFNGLTPFVPVAYTGLSIGLLAILGVVQPFQRFFK